jgi:hypothetical protein
MKEIYDDDDECVKVLCSLAPSSYFKHLVCLHRDDLLLLLLLLCRKYAAR